MGDRQSTGKSVGQDSRHLRPTVINGLDWEESRKLAAGPVESGKEALLRFGNGSEAKLLRSAADQIAGSFTPDVCLSETAVPELP
jgi:hypothetical protein